MPKKPHTAVLANDVEREAGLLLAACKLIKAMVNRSMLQILDGPDGATVRPQTMVCAEMFTILLVDFDSKLGPQYPGDLSMLSGLARICKAPNFNFRNSIAQLSRAVDNLDGWLSFQATFPKVWLSSIDKELTLTMERREFLYICGNVAKHNVFRLNVVAEKLLKNLQLTDPSVTIFDAYKAIEDFYEWFQNDIFLYHLTMLSQMLNDVLWGIHEYLKPEYAKAYTVDEERSAAMHAVMYNYKLPLEIVSDVGRVYYWDLMNELRAGAYVPRFETSKYLQGLY